MVSMLPLDDYLEPLVLTLTGLVVFALDVVVFHLLLGRQITPFGLIGFGAAVAGCWQLVETWQERKEIVRRLRDGS
jgi:hypothetical protein